MIVRRRHPRLVVDMREHLESQIGILVKQLQSARHALAAVFFHERLVRKEMLQFEAHLLPALRSGIAREDSTAVRDELIEVVRHHCPPWTNMLRASLIGAQSASAMRPPVLQRPRNWPSAPPRDRGWSYSMPFP